MKKLFTFLAICGLGALLAWGVVAGREEIKKDAEREQPVNAPSRVKDGVITLNEQTRKAAGIEVTKIEGEKIPASAIVWWDGKAFVYVQKSPDIFIRLAVDPQGSPPPQPIVTVGVQLLLSEELRSGIDVEEGG
ncbi:MAG: hypothetical protein KGI97_05985 [Alphaproteobacteria bacterium]|nr:hypothetical protein [Alphaproteobacteria bacterium]